MQFFPRLTRDQAQAHIAHLLRNMGDYAPAVVRDRRSGLVTVDANASAVFARQLEFVEREIYKVEYPELKARQILPVDYSVPTGAATFLYRMFDTVGEAQLVKDWSTDFPAVTIQGQEYAARVYHFGDHYAYSTQELREAAMAGMQLQPELAAVAREALERKLDTIAAVGMTGTSLTGFANHPNVPIVPVVGDWADPTTTGEAIKADVLTAWGAVFNGSPDQSEIDSMVTTPEIYSVLATRPINQFSQVTVLDFIKKETGIKNITFWSKLRTAGAGGTPRTVFYKKDSRTAKLVIPQETEQSPLLAQGFVLRANLHLSTGGVVIRQPLKMAYVDDVLTP